MADGDAIEQANALLRERGYAERDLAVHTGPRGKALLKGNKIISPLSDDAEVVLRVVQGLVPTGDAHGGKTARPAELRAKLWARTSSGAPISPPTRSSSSGAGSPRRPPLSRC